MYLRLMAWHANSTHPCTSGCLQIFHPTAPRTVLTSLQSLERASLTQVPLLAPGWDSTLSPRAEEQELTEEAEDSRDKEWEAGGQAMGLQDVLSIMATGNFSELS